MDTLMAIFYEMVGDDFPSESHSFHATLEDAIYKLVERDYYENALIKQYAIEHEGYCAPMLIQRFDVAVVDYEDVEEYFDEIDTYVDMDTDEDFIVKPKEYIVFSVLDRVVIMWAWKGVDA